MKKNIHPLDKKNVGNNSAPIFIHIGKCGGTTVRNELKTKGIDFFEKHLMKIEFRQEEKYIITIRNPISRFISAFNWRYKLVIDDRIQENRFNGEKNILLKYKSANGLAENIFALNGDLILDFKKQKYYIHHIKEDINFHIGDFLSKCNPENILAVLTTENLNQDLQTYFDIEATGTFKKNKKETHLSNLAVNNIIKYFEKDYECIEKLNNMDLLTTLQYESLSCRVQRFFN